MIRYILKRLLGFVPIFFGITLVSFFIIHLTPGKSTDIAGFSPRVSYEAKTRLAALEELFLTRDPAAKIFNILSAFAPNRAAQFAEYDYAIKNGKLDYEEALTDLALS